MIVIVTRLAEGIDVTVEREDASVVHSNLYAKEDYDYRLTATEFKITWLNKDTQLPPFACNRQHVIFIDKVTLAPVAP